VAARYELGAAAAGAARLAGPVMKGRVRWLVIAVVVAARWSACAPRAAAAPVEVETAAVSRGEVEDVVTNSEAAASRPPRVAAGRGARRPRGRAPGAEGSARSGARCWCWWTRPPRAPLVARGAIARR